MQTLILPCDRIGISRAAELLDAGEIVAIPTETVYGLAANALSEQAVAGIFRAKDRPADNPLITHIAKPEAVYELAAEVPPYARRLMEAFWPGPLTLILRRREGAVPDIVTAGHPTFAVRMPSHSGALGILRACGFPLAAPSANRSGKPSPTTAAHVLADMDGRIPLILDGGPCGIGLESTVVDVSGIAPLLLRPGGITLEALEAALMVPVRIAPGVDKPLASNEAARSPGLKHRHYAPDAPVELAHGRGEALTLYEREQACGGKPYLLAASLPGGVEGFSLGDGEEAAHNLFAALREADASGATRIIFEEVEERGIGYALMNRIRRAAHKQGEG